jgi:hypothetical protein
VKRLLGISLIALAGTGLLACGDDDDESATTPVETPTIETPTAPTTPTAPASPTPPAGETTQPAPSDGTGPSGKRPKDKRGKRGGETADLPKCSEIGGGPAPCRRPDGSVREPERL